MPRKPRKNQQKKKAERQIAKKVVSVLSQKPKRRKQKNKRMKGMMKEGGGAGMPAAFNGIAKATSVYNQQTMDLSGCDFLGTVIVPALVNDSTTIANYLINPQTLVTGSRLATFGTLWDKFRFKELDIIYEPQVGTTTNGSICVAADPDVLDDYNPIKGNTLVAKLGSTKANVTSPVYEQFVLPVRGKAFFDRDLYTEPESGSDPRNSYAGRIWLTTVGGLAAGTYGRLYVRWKIHFFAPNIDEEFDAGTAMIGALNGTLINSTYPWGNWSTVISQAPTTQSIYLPADFVTFTSDPTLGSVITFQSPGFYLVSMYRTGSAMGTGAFTSAVFNQCSTTLPTNSSGYTTGYNFSIANSGSTASMWIILVYASASGAYMCSTNDSGVTHSASYTTVSRIEMPVSPAANGLSAVRQASQGYVEQGIAQLRREFEQKLRMLPPALFTEVFSSTSSATITSAPDPSGAPSSSYQVSETSDVDQLAPIETIAAGLRNQQKVSGTFSPPAGYVLVPRSRE